MAKKSNSKPSKAASAKKRVVRPAAKVVKVARKPAIDIAALKAKRAAAKAAPVRKIKSPLTKAELEQFRRLLMEKRRALLGDMSGIEAEALRTNRQDGSGDLSNMPTHPADIGTDNFEQEFTLGLLESERTLLSEINAALDRIEAGTFGVCLGTGQIIGTPRLQARPWAKYCIEYAKLIEKGLVQPSEDRRDNDEEESAEDHEREAEDEDDFVEEEPEE